MTYLYIGNDIDLLVESVTEKIREDIEFKEPLLSDDFMVPDIHILNPTENESIGIDTVRRFIRSLQKKPFKESKQFGLILHFEKATIEAQNVLLKELEDHPSTSVYILVATEESGILPTIRSRSSIKFIESKISKEENKDLELLAKKFIDKEIDLIDIYAEVDQKDWNKSLAEQFLFQIYNLYTSKIGQSKKILSLFQQSSEFLKSNVSIKHILFFLLISLRNEI